MILTEFICYMQHIPLYRFGNDPKIESNLYAYAVGRNLHKLEHFDEFKDDKDKLYKLIDYLYINLYIDLYDKNTKFHYYCHPEKKWRKSVINGINRKEILIRELLE